MRCPKCRDSDTKVLESRVSHEGRSVRRRRSCMLCTFRFTTYEKQEDIQLQVEKRDNHFQNFSREKLEKAMQYACIKRPISAKDIEGVVAGIEKQLQDENERVVPSKKIGDLVMKALRDMDHISYVRFASIYKDFKDPEEFRSEIERLKN